MPGCIMTISEYIFPEIATKSNKIYFNTFQFTFHGHIYFQVTSFTFRNLFTLPFSDLGGFESEQTRTN